MTLSSLQHLVRAAQALADDRTMLVLGSASLLATHPSLGQPDAPLSSTFLCLANSGSPPTLRT